MNKVCTLISARRLLCLAMVALLWAAGCGPAPKTDVGMLAPLPTDGLLAVPADRDGVKLFDPVTPYAVAKHAPKVEYVAYPVSEIADWTHWGTGCLHSNGKIYTAIGDHGGTGADSYLYEFDPSAGRLRCLVSLCQVVKDFKPSDYGFSKVHGRICEGSDGKLYFSSFWGADADSPRYHGDRIFCFDPQSGQLADLGITVPGYGAPTTALDPKRMIFYGEFQHPTANSTDFVAYDLKDGRILFRGGHEGEAGPGRAILVDADGCAYYACRHMIRKYDPRTNAVTELPDRLLHRKLRQDASRARADGVMCAASRGDHSSLILLDPATGRVSDVGELWDEVKAMDMDATSRWVYYVADCEIPAEGDQKIPPELRAKKNLVAGLPVVQVDMANGASQKVVAFLEVPLRRAIGWEPRGKHTCYSLIASPDGRTLYINLNGFRPCDLGYYHATPLLVVVHVPSEELSAPVAPAPAAKSAPAAAPGL